MGDGGCGRCANGMILVLVDENTGRRETEFCPVCRPEDRDPNEISFHNMERAAMLFRKKPVVIEAHQLRRDSIGWVAQWCGGKVWSRPPMRAITGLTISTLEGDMNAEFGDWIIKGVRGEFYPCRRDIFSETYEVAE